ncbi:MAG: hypothetical protein LBR98_01230 [Syntrophomonadaceae bacterium]|jgi:lincosamide nucleotidyltransferase A/C/D/E|nr:hypothetical protein [Syntrophomonadaceae bacterium]
MMDEQDVVSLLSTAARIGVTVWVDGGWGVDALLGRQTREHDDIDILIEQRNAACFIGELKRAGYAEKRVSCTTPCHSVRVQSGLAVDPHLSEFDKAGAALYVGETCPAWIPGYQGGFRKGYEHDENDVRDVRLPCEASNLPLPEGYS